MVRVTLRRNNGWLVRVNTLAVAAPLHACAFIDFAGSVADYTEMLAV